MEFESAIPEHLLVKRTQPLREPKDFQGPKTTCYCNWFNPDVHGLVVLYLGVQRKKEVDASVALATIDKWLSDTPGYIERGSYNDPQGYRNTFIIAYWKNDASYQKFAESLPEGWWHEGLSVNGPIGVSFECYYPSISDTETIYSHLEPEGWGHLADRMTGPTYSHEYWGSARDRIPRSQTDTLASHGAPEAIGFHPGEQTLGRLVSIKPHDNLCVLRSGQNSTNADGKDLKSYVNGIKPVLAKGMNELEGKGTASNCFFNRFITLEEGDGRKTFSYSAWLGLDDLEAWITGRSHMAIFNSRVALASKEGTNIELYHENMVLKKNDQKFFYFNCHSRSGMLQACLPKG